MSPEWTPEFESQVHRLFSEAFAANEDSIVFRCIQELEVLGLTERQIQNGLAAGAIQMAEDLRLPDISETVFTMMNSEDVYIVTESLQVRRHLMCRS